MDSAERVQVRRALDELKPYLGAFIAQRRRPQLTPATRSLSSRGPDIQALLRTILDEWEAVFRRLMPGVAHSYIHELIDIRNRWAHEEPFSRSEANRACDTARQLGAVIGALESSNARDTTVERAAKTASGRRSRSQRSVMREIYAAHANDPGRIVHEYAAAERRGDVARKSNETSISAEDYARALLTDGERKGWLRDAG